jgi:single-strand DNA-binding protein
MLVISVSNFAKFFRRRKYSMASFNQIVLLGNLTDNPAVKQFDNSSVCNFRLAVNSNRGENKETLYIDVDTWNKLGEICNEYLSKGSQAMVTGRLRERSWETESGEKRSKTYIVATDVQFLDKRNKADKFETTEAAEEKPVFSLRGN